MIALRKSQDTRFQLHLWSKLLEDQIDFQKIVISSRGVRNLDKPPLKSTTKLLACLLKFQGTNRYKIQSDQNIVPKPENSVIFPKPVEPIRQELLKKLPVEYHAVEDITFNGESMWYPIYRFPHTRLCVSLIRFKLYLSLVSASAFCYNVTKVLMHANLDVLPTTALLSIFSLTSLCLIGNYFRKLVVQIYTSEDLQYVRLSRFSFFGRRLDIVLPLTSVLPLSENNVSARRFLLELKTKRPADVDLSYDNYEFYDEVFKITLRYGGILDRSRFEGVFGKILDKKV